MFLTRPALFFFCLHSNFLTFGYVLTLKKKIITISERRRGRHRTGRLRPGLEWERNTMTAVNEQPQGQETWWEELEKNLRVAERAAQNKSSTPGNTNSGIHSRVFQKYVEHKAKISIILTPIIC